MRKLVPLLAVLAAVFILGLPASLARAKTYKSYISATGTANVNCTLATPCLTFQSAHDATAPGGEISCLDGGSSVAVFPSLTITKSITIDCHDVFASILAGGTNPTNGIVVSIASGNANDPLRTVRIRNVSITGTGTTNHGA